MRARGLVVVAVVGAVVLAACGFGVNRGVRQVADTSATLDGTVFSTVAGPTTYWFEYGLDTDYGQTTSELSVPISDPDRGVPVSRQITGLAEATTYHYRICAENAAGQGICANDSTFTTTSGFDSVTGRGTVFAEPSLGFAIGASLDVRSAAGGGDVTGDVATSPGWYYFRIGNSGPATCMSVEGNRATIGFTADFDDYDPTAEPAHLLVVIEDNGPTGDRYGSRAVETPGDCPLPTDADFRDFNVGGFPIPPVITSGDFVVHDHG